MCDDDADADVCCAICDGGFVFEVDLFGASGIRDTRDLKLPEVPAF